MRFQATLYRRSIIPKESSDANPTKPGALDMYFGKKLRSPRVTKGLTGFGTLTGFLPCSRDHARLWNDRRRGWHLEARSYGLKEFEGRFERGKMSDGGVDLEFAGYWANAGDEPYINRGDARKDVGAILHHGVFERDYTVQLSIDDQLFDAATGYKVEQDSISNGDTLSDIAVALQDAGDKIRKTLPHHVMVWDDRRVWLQIMEFAAISYTIPRWSIVSQPDYGADLQETWTHVMGFYEHTEKSSEGKEESETEATDLITSDDAYPEEELGWQRVLASTGGTDVEEEEDAEKEALNELARSGLGADDFSMTVSGWVLDYAGRRVRAQHMRPGALVLLPSRPRNEMVPHDPRRIAFLTEVSTDYDTGNVDLNFTAAPAKMEINRTPTAKPTGTSGLQRAIA